MNNIFKKVDKVEIHNHNFTGGDVVINIGLLFVVAIAAIGLVMYLVYLGLIQLFRGLRIAVLEIADIFHDINATLTDPDLKPYFIAMVILIIVIAIGLGRLFGKFNLFYTIKNFFSDEPDIDWN